MSRVSISSSVIDKCINMINTTCKKLKLKSFLIVKRVFNVVKIISCLFQFHLELLLKTQFLTARRRSFLKELM